MVIKPDDFLRRPLETAIFTSATWRLLRVTASAQSRAIGPAAFSFTQSHGNLLCASGILFLLQRLLTPHNEPHAPVSKGQGLLAHTRENLGRPSPRATRG